MPVSQLDDLSRQIASMSREQLIRILRGFNCSFKMDFTDKCLGEMSLGRLKHIIMAAAAHAT